MATIDKLFEVYHLAKTKVAETKDHRLGMVLEDVGSWLYEWDAWLDEGQHHNEESPSGPRPSIKDMKLQFWAVGWSFKTGKNARVYKLREK